MRGDEAMYEKLAKIYYKDKANYLPEYEKRLSDYAAFHLPLEIKHYQSNDTFNCFYVNHSDLMLLYDGIGHHVILVVFI